MGAIEPPLDLDLRLIRYFVAVAETGNLTRAAQALHVAQPALSRQIHRLEQQLRVRLLLRGPKGAELTNAGRAFLPQACALLQSAERATAEARTADLTHSLVVGWAVPLVIGPAIQELRTRRPDADVSTVYVDWDAQHLALLDYAVDIIVGRSPFPDEGLAVTALYEEPVVLIVPADHRLARRDSVRLVDFEAEPLVRFPSERWNAFWRMDPRPDGRRAPDGPAVGGPMDKFELIATGHAVSLAPASVSGGAFDHALRYVPVEDGPRSRVVVAVRQQEKRPLVREFLTIVQAASDLRGRHPAS